MFSHLFHICFTFSIYSFSHFKKCILKALFFTFFHTFNSNYYNPSVAELAISKLNATSFMAKPDPPKPHRPGRPISEDASAHLGSLAPRPQLRVALAFAQGAPQRWPPRPPSFPVDVPSGVRRMRSSHRSISWKQTTSKTRCLTQKPNLVARGPPKKKYSLEVPHMLDEVISPYQPMKKINKSRTQKIQGTVSTLETQWRGLGDLTFTVAIV